MSISVLSYTELPTGRSSDLDASGNRTLQRQWLARFDINSATSAEVNQLEAYAESYTPVTWYAAHPAYPAARACKYNARPVNGDLSEWLCTVSYTSDLKRQQPARGDGTGTGGTGVGGSVTPATAQDNTTPASLRPPEIEIVRVTYEKVCEKDVVSGTKIKNTAGDRFDPPVVREASRLAIKLKFWRGANWSANWLTYFGFNDTVNSGTYSIGGASFPAKTLRCVIESIKPVWEVTSSGSPAVQSIAFHWEVSLTLEYEPLTWVKEVLSTGKRELVSGKLRPIEANGAIVSEPVPLKSDGTKAATSDAPYYQEFEIYQPVSFAGLLA